MISYESLTQFSVFSSVRKSRKRHFLLKLFSSIFLFVLFFFISNVNASAATYYVDFTDGLDTNNGLTPETAWKTLSKASSSASTAPGDTVLFQRGETWTGKLTINETGTLGNITTFGAYGTGANPIINASGQTYGIDIQTKSYLRFENITIQNATTGQFLLLGSLSNIYINSVTVTGGAYGLYLLSGTNSSISVTNSTFSGSNTAGLYLTAPITDLTLDNISVTGAAAGVIVNSTITNMTINSSTLSSNTTHGLRIESGGTISNLNITSSHFDSNTAGGFYNQGNISTSLITNSYFNSNTGHGISFQHATGKLVSGLTISGTEINNNGTTGLSFGNTGLSSDIVLSNLTLQDNSSYALYITSNITGLDLTDSVINSNNSEGVYFYTDTGETVSDVVISGTASTNNGQNGFAFHGPGSGTSATLTNVTATDNGHDGINVKTGWRNVNISGCTVNSNGTDGSGGDGDGISFHDSTTGSIRYCSINNNIKSAVAHVGDSDLTMAYNIFTHDTNGTIALAYVEGTGTYFFYNNVIFSASQTGNGLQVNSGTTATIKNNVVYGFDKGIYNNGGTVTEDYNQVYNAVTGWSGLAAGANSISTSPLFTNVGTRDFRLTNISPAINLGASVGETLDYLGNTVPQGTAPDLGAYEFLLPSVGSSLAQYKSDGSTAISTGDLSDTTTVVLKFIMSSGNASDLLTPQVEVQPIGTAFTNTVTNSGTAVSYSGSGVTGTVTVTGLGGGNYHWQARTTNPAGSGAWTSYGGNLESATDFSIDNVAPTGGSIAYTDGNYTPPTSVTLTVSDGTDPSSGINTSTRVVQRRSATLSGDTCGNYGSFATIYVTGTYPTFIDSGISSGNCYQYQYQVSDVAGNQATYASTNVVKVLYTPSSPNTCSNADPVGISPWIYSVVSNNSDSVILRFTNYQSPITHFVIEYGTKSGDYKYSVDNIDKNATSYIINSLSPNTTYYFRIRASNDCATGTWSNEISVKTNGIISLNQLDFVESELTPVEVNPTFNSCQTYTVKSGDSLWSIANNLFGDGNKYNDILEQNKATYSSLETSSSLQVGWELKINCDNSKTSTSTNYNNTNTGGYEVNIKVINTNKQPVKGAKVTLHSTPRETITDDDGIAHFTGVEGGDHRVIIAYNNFEGEQSINLKGDTKEFNLNITVTEKKVMFSKTGWIIVEIMALVIASLVFVLKRRGNLN